MLVHDSGHRSSSRFALPLLPVKPLRRLLTGAATFSFIDAVEKYGTRQTYAMVLSHMMEALRRQSGGASTPSALLGGLSGGLGGLVASFLMGPSTMGGQTPVLCCDKPVDLYATTLML